jgi:hypothetical protein
MSEHGRVSWLPWRGRNPVRWTLALALCVFAVVAATVMGGTRPPSVSPLATWAALLALVLAAWPSRRERPTVPPWRGADPLRNTVAFASTLIAVAVVLLDALGRIRAAWAPAAIATLFLASAIASPARGRWGWLHRLAWACAVGLSLWLWYRLTR